MYHTLLTSSSVRVPSTVAATMFEALVESSGGLLDYVEQGLARIFPGLPSEIQLEADLAAEITAIANEARAKCLRASSPALIPLPAEVSLERAPALNGHVIGEIMRIYAEAMTSLTSRVVRNSTDADGLEDNTAVPTDVAAKATDAAGDSRGASAATVEAATGAEAEAGKASVAASVAQKPKSSNAAGISKRSQQQRKPLPDGGGLRWALWPYTWLGQNDPVRAEAVWKLLMSRVLSWYAYAQSAGFELNMNMVKALVNAVSSGPNGASAMVSVLRTAHAAGLPPMISTGNMALMRAFEIGPSAALTVLGGLQELGYEPDIVTYNIVLRDASSRGDRKSLLPWFGRAIAMAQSGGKLSAHYTPAINSSPFAQVLRDDMFKPDAVSYLHLLRLPLNTKPRNITESDIEVASFALSNIYAIAFEAVTRAQAAGGAPQRVDFDRLMTVRSHRDVLEHAEDLAMQCNPVLSGVMLRRIHRFQVEDDPNANSFLKLAPVARCLSRVQSLLEALSDPMIMRHMLPFVGRQALLQLDPSMSNEKFLLVRVKKVVELVKGLKAEKMVYLTVDIADEAISVLSDVYEDVPLKHVTAAQVLAAKEAAERAAREPGSNDAAAAWAAAVTASIKP